MRDYLRNLGWFLCAALFWVAFPRPARAAADSAPARETAFHHTGWTGLGAVFDLKKSSDGYLWLTTSKGVLRFDGVRFQSVEEVTHGAVRDDEIDSVFMSPSGGLWLTTEGAGLLFWKDGRLTSYPDRRCTPTRKLGKIVEDPDGTLWIQATAGLFRLRGSVCEQVGTQEGYPGGFPAGILLDSDGTLWVKTRNGPLLYLPRGQSRFQRGRLDGGISTGFAYLHEGPRGGIWLSDDQGLRRVTTKLSIPPESRLETAQAGRNQFGDFSFGPDGSLWVVTKAGVQRFDHIEEWAEPLALAKASSATWTPEQGLTSDAVWKVLVDRDGVWIGTNSGLDWLRRAALTAIRLPPAQEREYGIAAGDDGSVWTGNDSLPLTRVAADGKITSFPQTRQALSIRRDHNGTIWSAGDLRLWRSSGAGLVPVPYPNQKLESVVFTATDRNGDLWITTNSGASYKRAAGKWMNETQNLGKKPGVIGAMADDQAGNVWFAFSNKVVRWDGSKYDRFSFPDGKRGVNENTMFVRGDHVWLGGAGGVQLFTRGQFYMMHWKDQDMPGRVSGIVETPTGDLWINGFSGITHVPASEINAWLADPNSAVSGERLNELDGLPGLSGETLPEPSVVEAPDGRLWFATTQGIAWLDPAALERNRNRTPPPVIISAVTANGKTYADANTVNLPAQSNNLEIDYTALSLAIPERVLFRYKLDGVDADWQNVGTRREAYYTKLRPGRYAFHVIACNNDGVWNETGATVNLDVAPAWFQTSWFLLLCVACVAALIFGFYRLRVRQVAASITARFDERLAERTRIARELHDTLLQGFLSASMQVHVAVDRLPGDSPVKPLLSRALQVMRQVIDESRNAVRGLRPSNTTSMDLEQAFATIPQEFETGNEEKLAELRIITEGQRRPLHPLLRDEVYRIGREAVTNAFRHARASRIDVELKYASGQFQLRVCDDGCGIAPEILLGGLNGHWGLSGMRERAERVGAHLHVFSKPSAGTEVELSVPGRLAFQGERRAAARA
ncbi:MAG TPA: triple tyrosine motif-containing protein [Candidatus Baltobacteraceae bacterium]|nr:triple tyrosine motif-containing protein [Candidatus Baltobacteraceae bacterium]